MGTRSHVALSGGLPSGSHAIRRARRRPSAVNLLAAGLLTALILLMAALEPTPALASAEEGCTPDGETACIRGSLRGSDGEPAEGVVLIVEGEGVTVEVETNDSGAWAVALTASGTYEVTLDEDTLPDGDVLGANAINPRTVQVELGSSTGGLFPIDSAGSGPAAPDEPDDDESPTLAEEDSPAGDPGAEAAAETAAAQTGGLGQRVAQLTASGLIFGLMLALASVGLSLVYGTTKLSNFSHGEMVTLGALMAYFFVQIVGMPLWLAGTLAVGVGLVVGYLQDRLLWGPIRRRRLALTQQMIVSIGLSMALAYGYNFIFGGGSHRIVTSTPAIHTFGPITLTSRSMVSLLIAVAALAAVAYMLTATRIGRATRAVSDDVALAAASGIDVDKVVRMVWVSGTALAALGGVLLGVFLGATRWNMGMILLLLMFAAVTLGGLGTAYGALIGSLVIGLVVELSTLVLPQDVRYASALFVLILMLLFRPQGILGRAERVG